MGQQWVLEAVSKMPFASVAILCCSGHSDRDWGSIAAGTGAPTIHSRPAAPFKRNVNATRVLACQPPRVLLPDWL